MNFNTNIVMPNNGENKKYTFKKKIILANLLDWNKTNSTLQRTNMVTFKTNSVIFKSFIF